MKDQNKIQLAVFWFVTPCSVVVRYLSEDNTASIFRAKWLHLDLILHRRENLKSRGS
jgi:hypothetical protein